VQSAGLPRGVRKGLGKTITSMAMGTADPVQRAGLLRPSGSCFATRQVADPWSELSWFPRHSFRMVACLGSNPPFWPKQAGRSLRLISRCRRPGLGRRARRRCCFVWSGCWGGRGPGSAVPRRGPAGTRLRRRQSGPGRRTLTSHMGIPAGHRVRPAVLAHVWPCELRNVTIVGTLRFERSPPTMPRCRAPQDPRRACRSTRSPRSKSAKGG
jgi:hypothetical protein